MQYVYKSLWLEKTTFYYFYGFLFFEYHTIMRVNYGDINYWKLFINEILLRR